MANIVAIVGRPNVGKSTLFNRLVEQRKAIMDNESGITRDRHYGYAEWTDRHFTVIDTGGYVQGSDDIFESAIREQVQIAIDEANVILFVVDCKDGLSGLDQDFAAVLRATHKPVLVVANKADNVSSELMMHDFYPLGMGTPYPISAASGTGTGELLDEVVKHLPEETATETALPPKVAILGRPNVGKSSFLNVLLGEDRSIVTPLAGTTRDAIDTTYKLYGKHMVLTDTAGIRRKSKVKDNIEFYSVIRAINALQEADVCVIMLDATQGLEAQDVNLIGLAHRYKKGLVLLVNKWDLIEKNSHTAETYKKELLQKLAPLDYIPVLFTSTVKKQRIYQAIEKALEVDANRKQKLATAALNKVMLAAIERYPPPAIKGKYIKIKYVTQLPTHTPVFAFFCNLPQYIKPPYKRYLEKELRRHFALEGVPVKLVFRKK
ncbi:MAG: ribosome biogenesis GTPase Der [Bacteroidota bacterium]